MIEQKTRLKLFTSEDTGSIIGFVSLNMKTNQLRGVREDSHYPKMICVLHEDLVGKIIPNNLYDVVLREMASKKGYIVVSAEFVKFKAEIAMTAIPKCLYKVEVSFGNKTIYYDPMDGKSSSSKTVEGVLEILKSRNDIKDKEKVIADFLKSAKLVKGRMEKDGYYVK